MKDIQWYEWIVPIVLWLIGLGLVVYSLGVTKESHQKKSLLDYTPTLGLSSSFLGFMVEIIFGLTIGLIMKFLPWWMAKLIVFLLGIGFVALGFVVIL